MWSSSDRRESVRRVAILTVAEKLQLPSTIFPEFLTTAATHLDGAGARIRIFSSGMSISEDGIRLLIKQRRAMVVSALPLNRYWRR